MKDSEKKMIVILLIVSVVVIGVLIFATRRNGGEETNQVNETEGEKPGEEYVNELEDGTKLNTSETLHQAKEIDGLEITEVQLTEKGNKTLLLGKITNKGIAEKTEVIKITLINKEGKDITTLSVYVEGIKPGESRDVIASTTLDYANAYDFKLSK